MNLLLGPKEYWDRANAKRQVINNFYFGAGFGFFTFTCFYGYSLDIMPVNVDPFKVPILTQNLAKPSSVTGKFLSEALLFAEHGENMLCTKIVLKVRNNFCTQHVLPRFELGIFMY